MNIAHHVDQNGTVTRQRACEYTTKRVGLLDTHALAPELGRDVCEVPITEMPVRFGWLAPVRREPVLLLAGVCAVVIYHDHDVESVPRGCLEFREVIVQTAIACKAHDRALGEGGLRPDGCRQRP